MQGSRDVENAAIVSGNHDDGVRLAASAPLAAEEGIYLFGSGRERMPVGGERPVRAVASGEGYVVIENAAGERVYINALPYPNEARLKEERTEETYPEKLSRWIARGEAGYDGATAHILLTHLFVAGGKTSESERDIDLGGARAVPRACLPRDGYVALGHLHKPQKLDENVRYSGSLLQYSFDEGEKKCALLLKTEGKRIVVEKEVALTAGKRLVRLEAEGVDAVTLHLTAPLTAQETQALRSANEGLVSLIVRTEGAEATPVVRRSMLSSRELFAEYYRSVYGEAPPQELTQAFLELLERS